MKIDLAVLFGYLNDMAGAILPLFSLFGVIAGLYLLGSASMELLSDGRGGGGPHAQGPNLSAIGVKVLIAACLLQFATSIEWTSNGLMDGVGGGAREAMALVIVNQSPTWELILKTSFLWLQLVGVAGMFRGFLKLHEAGSGDNQRGGSDPFWSGVWHLIGGAILINIGGS